MPEISLFHVAIKTVDLEKSRRFYCDLLGLVCAPRANLPFPGLWLSQPGREDLAIIHLYAGDAALEDDGTFAIGAGTIDHVSLKTEGFYEYRARLEASGAEWRENVLPDIGVWQIFAYDPSRVLIELTFIAENEAGDVPVVSPEKQYRPRERFFE
ncbi:VOC family protein [Croceicoccus sediminis]|uniref:VOC family protein n=1 Tax=Croceicoccus sediminis TaxID=2571150 RepID=UPI00118317EF|nr:VOC family protein [Croceicoccus sediminis]